MDENKLLSHHFLVHTYYQYLSHDGQNLEHYRCQGYYL